MSTSKNNKGFLAWVYRKLLVLSGFLLVALVVAFVLALATWDVYDPSYSYATSRQPNNLLGYSGAVFADIMMQFLGLSSVISLLPLISWSLALISGKKLGRWLERFGAWIASLFFSTAFLACYPPSSTWPIQNGFGGIIGDMVMRLPVLFIGSYPTGAFAFLFQIILVMITIWLMLFSSGIIGTFKVKEFNEQEKNLESPEESKSLLALGILEHIWFSFQAHMFRIFKIRKSFVYSPKKSHDFHDISDLKFDSEKFEDDSVGSSFFNQRIEPILSVDYAEINRRENNGDKNYCDQESKLKDNKNYNNSFFSGQSNLQSDVYIEEKIGFSLPSIKFLKEPKNIGSATTLSHNVLQSNARMLESVLDDFGVKGEIINVRPGPVVTLYELEPAPGIKSSRIIGLSDDIARSMSAVAARVAVISGRNVIGIELPNVVHETVFLKELIMSSLFQETKAKLAIALGKNIGGDPIVVDLAKMPHLLIAGTTGSGKSVAINTMILSLLYKMTPEQCRLIMIDPKMLELSVYDGIPHLLSPVVTDPKKAIVALKWIVREMEERYRKMSKIGVRNIDGFNMRVTQALDIGENLSRTVQTGFDQNSGEAIYETEEFDLQPMPYIVVVIDEMADLMMVAGKDIESAIQRLAQMARASGIHVIMATQRPSVDVITGTIKANFPTRMSFQVSSKIDSRTILGEQGAEQLLGQGDMLYMTGGGRIQRIHSPFVSDNEVEKIVSYLKTQGLPKYLDKITDDSDEKYSNTFGKNSVTNSDELYNQAVAIVLRDKKASTSYIQRRLGIGYNRAASLIEKMEEEGVIGPASSTGKREILVSSNTDFCE
ncbi:cell division protein FtsK [Liberibacter crescens]|nr:cell division protein FtsK [Liberibacter crescens]